MKERRTVQRVRDRLAALRPMNLLVRTGSEIAVILGLLFISTMVFSQAMPSPANQASDGDPYIQSRDSSDFRQSSDSSGRSNPSPRDFNQRADGSGLATVLSANQIIAMVRTKPEVTVDLKQVMANYFSKKGIAVQEDSITDEILFSNLASNAGLREAISVWLRARGYASDEDFAQSPDSILETQSSLQDRLTDKGRDTREIGEDRSAGTSQLALDLQNLPADSELLPQDSLSSTLNNRQDQNVHPEDENRKTDALNKQPIAGQLPSSSTNHKNTDSSNPSEIEVLHQTAPYNLQALRDLYTQVPEQSIKIRRFGSDVFLTRGMATREMPIDLPIGPDYVIGPGDGLTISLWGSVSQSFTRVIDREGKLVLPEAGSVVVTGLTLERAQALIQGVLSRQFKDAHVSVSVAHLRTVRVYVVGDVQRPGAYDISSLSTPLNALYAAGGPTAVGSLRTARHYRGSVLVREIDLYDFLLHGIREDVDRLEPGDTILVPAAGPQVEVSGMVKRPATYELKGEMNLSEVLDEAGGLRAAAALTQIRVERIGSEGHRATLNVDLPKDSTIESGRKLMNAFSVKDGDRVVVAPVLPYSEKAIYLTGHVVRPGKLPYRDGMKLSDAIRTYQDLLPEPADHGVIIRLVPPDLRPEAIDFNVTEVLAGNTPIYLQPFDTIRILGRYEADAPRVTVRGEVLRPGAYALVQGMTAAQLVRISGGFKRSALLDEADLASYEIKNGKQVVSRRSNVAIGQAVTGLDQNADVPLKPGDVLTVHQVSGWNDIGASVTLTGEVKYPGTYGLQEGERLSSLILRAGGFRTTAYPDGAVLVRKQVKELEERSRAELIHQIETTSVGGRLGQNVSGGDETGTLQLLIQQQNQVLQRLRSQQAVGRLVIKIDGDIAGWSNTSADIELRSGDVLTVPKRPGFILISGQVYNASALTYAPGKEAGWYLRQAGGSTELANRKEIFVVRANGLVVGRRSGGWGRDDVLSTRLNPGDVVVVPQKIVGGSVFWKNMLATAQVVSSIAFTAALALR